MSELQDQFGEMIATLRHNKRDLEAIQEKLEAIREMNLQRLPNLLPVIEWLENGCDPKEAAKELRIYQEKFINKDKS